MYELTALLDAKQSGTSETALAMTRRMQETRALDSYAMWFPMGLSNMVLREPPFEYKDRLKAPAHLVPPAGFPKILDTARGKPAAKPQQNKGPQGKGEGTPGPTNPDMRCAFGTIAAIDARVFRRRYRLEQWRPKPDYHLQRPKNQTKHFGRCGGSGLDRPARPQTRLDITVAYRCKCRQTGKSATSPAHVMSLDNKATKPSFHTTSNCPLCQETTDEYVEGTPDSVAVWVGRMTSANKPSRRQVQPPRTIKHNGATYELIALAHHRGAHEDGHWFAQVRRDGVWTEMNGGVTKKMNLPQKSTTATLLVYLRKKWRG
jgi:hypothetical protein